MNQFEVTEAESFKDNLIKNTISAAVESLSTIELCMESKNELKSKLYALTKNININNKNAPFSSFDNKKSKNSSRKSKHNDQPKKQVKDKNLKKVNKCSNNAHQSIERKNSKSSISPYEIRNSNSQGKFEVKNAVDYYVSPFIEHGNEKANFIKSVKKKSTIKEKNDSSYKFSLITSKELEELKARISESEMKIRTFVARNEEMQDALNKKQELLISNETKVALLEKQLETQIQENEKLRAELNGIKANQDSDKLNKLKIEKENELLKKFVEKRTSEANNAILAITTKYIETKKALEKYSENNQNHLVKIKTKNDPKQKPVKNEINPKNNLNSNLFLNSNSNLNKEKEKMGFCKTTTNAIRNEGISQRNHSECITAIMSLQTEIDHLKSQFNQIDKKQMMSIKNKRLSVKECKGKNR